MSYEKTEWKDRKVENPRTYSVRDNEDGTITLLDAPGEITEAGTPVNAENMNNIEQGIYDAHTQVLYQKTLNLESTVITLQEEITRYIKNVSASDDFTINVENIKPNGRHITFELILNMSSVVSFSLSKITTKWLGGEAPDLSEAGQHWFAFTSFDNGSTWIGSYEGRFNI